MAVPKKRTISKKHIRRNFWKRKGYWAAVKAFSLAKSNSNGYSKVFFVRQKNEIKKQRINNNVIRNPSNDLNQHQSMIG